MNLEILFSIAYSIFCAFMTAWAGFDRKESFDLTDFVNDSRKKFINSGKTTIVLLVIGVLGFSLIFHRNNVNDWSSILADFLAFTVGQLIAWGFDLFQFYKKLDKKKNIIDNIGSNNSNYKFQYDGVFAVSAIMVSHDYKQFLLVKRITREGEEKEDLWVQPGAYYRTNEIKHNAASMKLPAFYDFITSELNRQTGLNEGDYRPLFINGIFKEKNRPFDYTVESGDPNIHENRIFQPSLFIQEEIPVNIEQKKTSNTSVHIDSFYSFVLKESVNVRYLKDLMVHNTDYKYKDISLFTLDQIRDMVMNNQCYKDIYSIMKLFLRLFRKDLFIKKYQNNIRYCTFNQEGNTLWLRLNNNCNLNCSFCLLKDRQSCVIKELDVNKIEDFIRKNQKDFKKNKAKYKVIITGGEPFLIKNLSEIVLLLNKHDWVKSISICTNGTLQTEIKSFVKNIKVKNAKDKIKFVINMPACNCEDHNTLTNTNDKLNIQETVVKYLIAEKYKVTANVIMTTLLSNNLNKYFDYWISLGIKNVAFSYAIQIGILARKIDITPRVLSKSECLDTYKRIGNGDFQIELFEQIELMIPSCDEVKCQEKHSIIACYYDDEKGLIRNKKEDDDCCLDTNV